MMHFQELAAFLREDLAGLSGDLSIKLCTLATKVGTAADPITTLAHDAALLSSIYRKLAEVMLRTSAFTTTIFSYKALDQVEISARASSLTLTNLNRNVEEASTLTRGLLQSSADGIKFSEDKQPAFDPTQFQSSSLRTEFSETKNFMLLIYHLGDLASDVKPKWDASFNYKSSSFLISNAQLGNMGSDLLQGSKRQAMFDSILALQAAKDSASKPPFSPGQSITGPLVAQPSNPAVSLDEDYEMIDTPSTLPGSPVILERDIVEPTFSCALPDRSLPISIKSARNKRRLSIDASDKRHSDTTPKPTRKGRPINTIDQVDSHSKDSSNATNENENIHALGIDQNEEWTLLGHQNSNPPSETGPYQDDISGVHRSGATKSMLLEQRATPQALKHPQEQKLYQPLQGAGGPISQENPVSNEMKKDADQLKPSVHADTSAFSQHQAQLMRMQQMYQSGLRLERPKQGSTPPSPPHGGNHALQDYQMQLMLLEQQNKKRLLITRQHDAAIAPPPSGGNNGLQECQMLIIQQEQQYKKRLLMHLQEQNASQKPTPARENQALQGYQMQNIQQEQENKKRLLMTRQEQDPVQSSGGPAAYTCQSPNLGTQKIPVKQPDTPSLPHGSVTPDMLEKARMVLLKYRIRFSALSSDQRNSFAAQTFIIQDNLARTWAQEPTLLYSSVEQELIRHGIDPEHLTAAQLVAFVAQRPDMQKEAVQVYVRIQEKENQVHAQNLARNQEKGIQACGQKVNWNPDQQQLLKQGADNSKDAELKRPVRIDPSPPKNESNQRPQHPSPAPITCAGRQSHGQTINERSTEILRKHGLKSETLTADQVNLLQSATGEQLERFVKAWVETSQGVQPSNTAISAHPSPQEQQRRHLCSWCPSEQQRMVPVVCSLQQAAQREAPGAQVVTQERISKLLRERHTFGKDSQELRTVEQQEHGGILWQPRSMGEIQSGLLTETAKMQETQKAQWEARQRADETRRQREVQLNVKIAERAKELLKADQVKAAEQQKQAEQEKMQQRLAGEYGEQVQKIAEEQQKVRERMKKAYSETLEKQKEYFDAQLAKQPRPEKPAASIKSMMERQRMMQQLQQKKTMAEQAWRKFEEAKKMPVKTSREAQKGNEQDVVKNSEDAKNMTLKTPGPVKKGTKEDEVKDWEKVQKQPLGEEQIAGLKIVEGLLREYTTLYDWELVRSASGHVPFA